MIRRSCTRQARVPCEVARISKMRYATTEFKSASRRPIHRACTESIGRSNQHATFFDQVPEKSPADFSTLAPSLENKRLPGFQPLSSTTPPPTFPPILYLT